MNEQLGLATQGQAAAKRAEAARKLHSLVDEIRFLHCADGLPKATLRKVAASCRDLWQRRSQALEYTVGSETQPAAEKEQVKADLRDVGVIWAGLCVRLGLGDSLDAARREALEVLAETEKLFGSSPVLFQERRTIAASMGQKEADTVPRKAEANVPQTAWEYDALGRSFLQAGDLERAAVEFEHALDLEPQGFWPNFHEGLCAYRLKHFEEALSAFRTCVALRSETAWCYYNRALVYEALGRRDRALKDYGKALHHDPKLAAASLNRGLLHFREKRYAAALDDLRDAQQNGADKAVVQHHWNQVVKAQKLDKRER
jgi:tetratricopeptide (TPR) repeat protein